MLKGSLNYGTKNDFIPTNKYQHAWVLILSWSLMLLHFQYDNPMLMATFSIEYGTVRSDIVETWHFLNCHISPCTSSEPPPLLCSSSCRWVDWAWGSLWCQAQLQSGLVQVCEKKWVSCKWRWLDQSRDSPLSGGRSRWPGLCCCPSKNSSSEQ